MVKNKNKLRTFLDREVQKQKNNITIYISLKGLLTKERLEHLQSRLLQCN